MVGGDILVEIICEIIAHVAGAEITEVIDKILKGDDLQALVDGGDSAAMALQNSIVGAGIDPASLSSADWTQFDQVAQSQLGGSVLGDDLGASIVDTSSPISDSDF